MPEDDRKGLNSIGHIEIERKFLSPALPDGLGRCPHKEFLQGYFSTSLTVRVRRKGEAYVLTYEGSDLLKREEYSLPLTAESSAHLLEKCDSLRIQKARCLISLPGTAYAAEFNRFQRELVELLLVEVEFPDETSTRAFTSLAWFGREVTGDSRYQNSSLNHFRFPGEEKAWHRNGNEN